ncbi:hypothetical protein [Kribbella sp. CA-294648]|uniref:hypothetical protein n=1 Tax=Kribbella sp. CA-294648 TaxID=3239948 RepID=UPI003D8BBD09
MTPRPAAKNNDESARYFLDAAAQLIDAMFVTSAKDRPRALRSIDFPAALQWLTIDDVIEVASHNRSQGASRKAFHNRWESKEAFIKDAIIHTMLYRDDPSANPALRVEELQETAHATSVSDAIGSLSESLLQSLLSHPRSFLLLHVGALLDHHPDLRAAVVEDMMSALTPWYQGYADLITRLGVTLRPGWTVERFGLTLQAMLDGFLLRSRVQREQIDEAQVGDASLFADAVIAFTLGVVDLEGAGRTVRQALDIGVRGTDGAPRAQEPAPGDPGIRGAKTLPKAIDLQAEAVDAGSNPASEIGTHLQ